MLPDRLVCLLSPDVASESHVASHTSTVMRRSHIDVLMEKERTTNVVDDVKQMAKERSATFPGVIFYGAVSTLLRFF